MKIIITILVILPFLGFSQFSNDYKVSTGTPYRVIDAYGKYYFNEGDDVMMIKESRKKLIIQKYNTVKGKEVSRKEYEDISFSRIVKLKDNYFMISKSWNKDKETLTIFYRNINFEEGTLGNKEEFASLEGNNIEIYYLSSYDESKFLVKYLKKRKSRNDKLSTDEYGLIVFDSNLDEIWNEDEIVMPFTEAEMNNIDYAIDGNGVLNMLIEVYDSEVSKKYVKGEKNYHLELLRIEKGEIDRVKLDRDDYYINSIWLNEGADNVMYLAGFYNEEKGSYSNIEGVFMMTLDKDGEIENSNHYKIPLELINLYEKKKEQKKNERKKNKGKLGFEDLDLDAIYYQADGSILLIGEQYYVTTHTTTSSSGYTSTRYVYHYEDLLVTKINSDGELEWMKKLPKRQKSGLDPGGNSYTHVFKNDNHYFFYIDREDNMDLSIDKMPKMVSSADKEGIFSVFKINDSSGKVSKDYIFDMGEIEIAGEKRPLRVYQFKVSRIQETSSGIAVEVYKKGKEDVVINVDF